MNDATILECSTPSLTAARRSNAKHARHAPAKVPTANDERDRDSPLHFPAERASHPRELACNARKEPRGDDDGPGVLRGRGLRREHHDVPRDRHCGSREDEGTAHAQSVGQIAYSED